MAAKGSLLRCCRFFRLFCFVVLFANRLLMRSNDVLHGGAGDDNQHGGKGNDVLYGSAGEDDQEGCAFVCLSVRCVFVIATCVFLVRSGLGNDVLHGGAGYDRQYGDFDRGYTKTVDSVFGGLGVNGGLGYGGDSSNYRRFNSIENRVSASAGGDDILFADDVRRPQHSACRRSLTIFARTGWRSSIRSGRQRHVNAQQK
jgi:Ca2+-binding RTX toxin-like protein